MGDVTGAYCYQPGEGELRWMSETSTYFLATGEQTAGAFCLVDEQASRGESVPLHAGRRPGHALISAAVSAARARVVH